MAIRRKWKITKHKIEGLPCALPIEIGYDIENSKVKVIANGSDVGAECANFAIRRLLVILWQMLGLENFLVKTLTNHEIEFMEKISTLPVVLLVKVYQKYAPKDLRASCRFEPTCSNYMLLALEKYGLIRGLYFGLNRFFRCKVPNGGFDYP